MLQNLLCKKKKKKKSQKYFSFFLFFWVSFSVTPSSEKSKSIFYFFFLSLFHCFIAVLLVLKKCMGKPYKSFLLEILKKKVVFNLIQMI